MTIKEALRHGTVDSLDRELLLANVLRVPRTTLFSDPDRTIPKKKIDAYTRVLARRKKGEPLAYILGEKEFFGRPFAVHKNVLIPRPATEDLIAHALDALKTKKDQMHTIDSGIIALIRFFQKTEPTCLVDIGTGSGAIGVTLALEQSLPVIATDLSEGAIKIAKKNAKALKADVTFKKGDLLIPIKHLKKPFFVISNPPYVPKGATLMKDVSKYEPKMALYSGKNGLDIIERLIDQCKRHPFCTGIALECRSDQRRAIESFFDTETAILVA